MKRGKPVETMLFHAMWYIVVLVVVVLLVETASDAQCLNRCYGHGTCLRTGVCSCNDGWSGSDCRLRLCSVGRAWADLPQGNHWAHQIAECSNRGHCDRAKGKCICEPGFTGAACQRLDCPSGCSGHGICATASYNYHSVTNNPLVFFENWAEEKMTSCKCDNNFEGVDCSRRRCPRGPISLDGGKYDIPTKQLIRCDYPPSVSTRFSINLRGKTTESFSAGIQEKDLQAVLQRLDVHERIDVVYKGGTSFCDGSESTDISGNIVELRFYPKLEQKEKIQVLDSNGNLLQSLDDNMVWIATHGEDLLHAPDMEAVTSTQGNLTHEECNGRGNCNTKTGQCSCDCGFGPRQDKEGQFRPCAWLGESTKPACCPREATSREDCTIDKYCSDNEETCFGHGKCDSIESTCQCHQGWQGIDCSEKECPRDVSWNLVQSREFSSVSSVRATCSDKGICDTHSGECKCFPPFFGNACEKMKCSSNGCSGHGNCLPMSSLASEHSSFVYGSMSIPGTWDADRIYGCQCDKGYTGFDCSLRSCTNEPKTYQYETQSFYCHVSKAFEEDMAPSFKISFGQLKTQPVRAYATGTQLESILEKLPNIRATSVSFSNPDAKTICSTNDTQWSVYVTFWNAIEHGSLLRFVDFDKYELKLPLVASKTKQLGVKIAECNGHGTCNSQTALCTCSSDWKGSYDCSKRSTNK